MCCVSLVGTKIAGGSFEAVFVDNSETGELVSGLEPELETRFVRVFRFFHSSLNDGSASLPQSFVRFPYLLKRIPTLNLLTFDVKNRNSIVK